MQTKQTPSSRADHMDVEQFRSMVESPAFRRFLERVSVDFYRAVDTCAEHNEELTIRRAQGAAAALRVVLALPQQMLTEMRQTAAKGKGA